jgi:cell wall-associated NlpC family hydrolase
MQLAVQWARREARRHMHEVGTTNCSRAITRWERHMGLAIPAAPPCRPWCGAFLHEAFWQAGIRLSPRLIDPNEAYADAVTHQNGLKAIPKTSVRPGDIVFFSLHGAGVQATHEGLVVGRPHRGHVRTAEGNVAHHAVLARRGLRYIVLAARVTRRPTRRPRSARHDARSRTTTGIVRSVRAW